MSDRVLRFKRLQGALGDRLPASAMQLEGNRLVIRASDAEQLSLAMRTTREHGLAPETEVAFSVEAFDLVQLVDPHSCLCEVGAHVPLQVLEARLKTSGLTLGPLSPGALALRVGAWLEGAHASMRPIPGGRLEPAALCLEAALWSGRSYRSHRSPRSASGPDLDHLLLGGHGAIGRVTGATLRIAPRPTTSETRTVLLPDGASAVALLQQCLATEAVPAFARLSGSGPGLALTLRFDGLAFRVHRDGDRVAQLANARGRSELPVATATELRSACESEVSWPNLARVIDSLHGRPLELHRLARESVVAVTDERLQGPGVVDLTVAPTVAPTWWPALAAPTRGEA